MKQIKLAILFSILCKVASAQTFLNGDFEINTAVGDQINLSNTGYTAMMANSESFGTYGDMDIITSNTYGGGPQSGNWFVAFTAGGTDMISLTLSSALAAGNSYTISFYDRAAAGWTGYPFQIGLSTVSSAFGTVLYTSPVAPITGTWTQRSFTFVAPFSALYITVAMTGTANTTDWAQTDNFVLTANTISSPLQSTATASFATCFGVCNGDATATPSGGVPPYHYVWSFTNDTTATTDSLCAGGVYYVTVTDAIGSSVVDSVFLPVIDPVLVNISSNVLAICAGDTTSVCAPLGFVNYDWSTGETSACIVANQSGNYSVTVTTANNCIVASNQVSITVYPNPIDSISASQSIFCSGDSTQVCTTTSSVSYLWNTGQTTACIYANHAGNYYVTVSDANNCTAVSNHLAVNVYPIPPVSISVNGDTLTSYNGVTYQWYFNSNPINNANSPVYVTKAPGLYTVEITDSNGCRTVSNPVNVVVSGITSIINYQSSINLYPNPATDQLFIESNGVEITGVKIYNTLGEVVLAIGFSPDEAMKQMVGGQLSIINLPRGVYIAEIKTKDVSVKRRWVKE